MEAMGTDDRLPAAALIARLIANPQGFDLFQAISLLERAVPHARALGRGNGAGEAVRLTGSVSLAFEPSDVRSVRRGGLRDEPRNPALDLLLDQVLAQARIEVGIEAREDSHKDPHDSRTVPPANEEHEPHELRERHRPRPGRRPAFTLSTAALTLAGANGPLPMPFTELVLEAMTKRDFAMADLLDIFNHRFLSFLYRSRKKHAPGLNWRSPHSSAIAACLDTLSNLGLNGDQRGPHDERLWLRHAGLLSAAPRSMTGLLALLSDRLGVPVRGAQFVGGWRDIDASDSLRLARVGSRAPRLGGQSVLGRRAWDQAAGIRIEFADLSRERFTALLPGGRDHALAQWLIRCYLQQDFDVEFVLKLAPQRVSCALGGPRAARLGWTSWVAGGARRSNDAGDTSNTPQTISTTHARGTAAAARSTALEPAPAPAPVRLALRAATAAGRHQEGLRA
ncbi:type VI secretion system baseplate subunit TssG [Paraburkholderia sp. ZP32-5]|uniref:type VI secretion system baseplate subunit TssG n=1 Tax=Paraburkholderia sp. ZP32-5 TaxID=2883245 RepID=UPI001F23B0F7|nr:type VI secretion system baseplate subunit TssG [Paraburkholderia sp. ZP32-5]